jgi:hypothetical protein
MAKQSINVGTAANDKKGDSLRAAFQKVNANFTELYTALGLAADANLNLGAFEFAGSVMSTTDSTPIVIDQSVTVSSDLTVGGDIVPNIANGGNLGSLAKPFRSLYVSNSTVFLGGVPLSLEAGTNELRVNNVPISQNITYTDIPNAPRDVSDLTDTGNLLGGGAGGGLSITDFGRGFTDTLDDGKITTNKLYNRPANQGLNNHFELSVTNGGVVTLPDGSIINGATLKTIAGNYAGITAGPASPAGRDEDSWVWVDNDGATIATKYSTDNYQWKFDNTGNLILPNGQSIGSGSLDGIKMTTDRGTVLFGNSPECVPTLLTHFHIMKDDPANVDLFLGDDNNYVKLPGSGETAYGVEIGTNVGSAYTWRFGTDGDLTLPEGGVISETDTTTIITPPGAAAGQSLVIRPTAVSNLSASGYIVPGVNLTITLTNGTSVYSGDPITYTITGATAQQLGIGSLAGTFSAFSPSNSVPQTTSIVLPIPEYTNATTFTLTLGGSNPFAPNSITVTDNGVIETSHVHLVAGDPATTDIFLGDDDQYVKIAKNGGDVVVGTDSNTNQWIFGTDGNLTLPEGGDILDSNGDSVLGGGSYTPDDSDNWNDPTVNTVAAALDELAAKVAALENFEIDGGNAYTPAAGELIIDGNGA